MTFSLAFTVLQTAVNSDLEHSSMACFVIGLALFLGRSLLILLIGLHQSYPSIRSSFSGVDCWTQGGRVSLGGSVGWSRTRAGVYSFSEHEAHAVHVEGACLPQH